MKWQDRVEKTAIALNLIGLGLGICILGIFILVKRTIAGGSWIHGILGIVVGLVFLLFAFYFCKHTVLSDSRKLATFPKLYKQARQPASLLVDPIDLLKSTN